MTNIESVITRRLTIPAKLYTDYAEALMWGNELHMRFQQSSLWEVEDSVAYILYIPIKQNIKTKNN